jgi:hypothetical protein
MTPFHVATDQHASVREAARRDEAAAELLWNALADIAEPPLGTFAEALRVTMPARWISLFAEAAVAVAYAFKLGWEQLSLLKPGATPFEMRQTAKQVWTRFEEMADRALVMAQGFSGGASEDAAWGYLLSMRIPVTRLAEVEKIARLAGRMQVSLRGEKARRVPDVPEEVYSVTQGSDPGRLLPAELAVLGHPLLGLAALHRIATRQAAIYAVRGTSKMERGPLVLLLDESDSMAGDRNVWTKATAITLALAAAEDNRPVSVVHYSTSVENQPLDPKNFGEVIRMVRRFLAGGTDIALALRNGLAQVRLLSASGKKGADLILVTDGEDGNYDGINEALDEADALGVRLWTVAIEKDISESSPLRTRAARYVLVDSRALTQGDSITLFVEVN